jgi:hypothetical protein
MADNFHADYVQFEEEWSKTAQPFADAERKLRAEVRAMTQASSEEREARYVEGYEKILRDYEKQHEATINASHSHRVGKAEDVLFGPGGGEYANLLVGLAGAPDERLPELYALAAQSNQPDLLRAVAHTARQRGGAGLFDQWARSDPERAGAVDYLARTPNAQRFVDRTLLAHKPPKADPASLEPSAADRERASEAERAKRQPVQEFFAPDPTGGKRQTGRRTA